MLTKGENNNDECKINNICVNASENSGVSNRCNVNTNILIIGIGISSHIDEQYDSPTLPIFSFKSQLLINDKMHPFVKENRIPNVRKLHDLDGSPYSDSVLRDYLRCRAINKMYPHTFIHSFQMCTDGIRDSVELSQHEINDNCDRCR